jgi:hypothetical protein
MMQTRLSEDEFRILLYIRAYADNQQQHLDPGWVREQLCLSPERIQRASRLLAELGLAEFFEFNIPEDLLRQYPQFGPNPTACDICLTERGWNYLRAEQIL